RYFAGAIISDDAHDNAIEGNYIGTDVTGTVALPNHVGINVFNHDAGPLIGTHTTGNAIRGNLISGNTADGVRIVQPNTDDNRVVGNLIGTTADGSAALGNGDSGVLLALGAVGNVIGGPTAADRNVISGNDGPGVWVQDLGTSGNVIEGNYLGTDAAGTHA